MIGLMEAGASALYARKCSNDGAMPDYAGLMWTGLHQACAVGHGKQMRLIIADMKYFTLDSPRSGSLEHARYTAHKLGEADMSAVQHQHRCTWAMQHAK